MTKRRMILVLVACTSIAAFAVQTLSQVGNSNQTAKPSGAAPQQKPTEREEELKESYERLRNMTPEQQTKAIKARLRERQREFQKQAAENKRQRQQKSKELAEEGRPSLPTAPAERQKRQKEAQEEAVKIRREFLREKAALGVTEEQWKLIKPRLEKVRQLREQVSSGVGLSLGSAPSDDPTSPRRGPRVNVPTWQWKDMWKGNAPGELTEPQKIVKQLIALVQRKNVALGTLQRTMDALRKARREGEPKLEAQLAEARRELREVLTTRQEAALVLMNRI